ncbi:MULTISPECIES: LysE family translocator [unclassified Rhodococcus (in: high G+C Gram-positive bacteria)]|jgi:threonine/homoserine/homoserine lactone efflux protein|uniref:LysE family translocator n=1 Tax=unclassified Rhodococcus (in: high G+C Gram-positive bacteria) TaxID=192944 RepID=UPI000B3CD6E5|nr:MULTISPECIES: LysE family translocator [unclassified Rhodococcus (in: high G+C Gram-positive bacteria)]KAF0961390.1 Threonine efflux protein [Rhodococcus sp. T7]OUS84380.1 threonine transporter RhtB [Rhodococcus sp. NCIMB 12038]
MIGVVVTAFAVLGLLTVIPGPDMAVVTRAGLSGGRSAALRATFGVVAGLMVWGALTVVGLGAVLAASAEAYTVVKIVGGMYLVYLGLSTLWRSRTRPRAARTAPAPVPSSGSSWRAGFLTNLLNPKIAVFYTGLLPQLVPPGWPTAPSLALLVLVHGLLGIVWLGAYSILLTRARTTLEKPSVRKVLDRITGTVLFGFGAVVVAEAR